MPIHKKGNNTTIVKNAPIDPIPLEILANIAGFLEGKNLAHLRQMNHLFKDAVDTLYQDYSRLYQRLREIEPTLSQVLPRNNFLKAYHEAFQKVKTLQQDEIQYLTKKHELDRNTFAIQEINVTDLEKLELQGQKLNEANSNIIKKRIDLNSTFLNLGMEFITRLPIQLFEANEYANFWKGLKVLNITINHIRILPTAISNCQALEWLYCDYNQLVALPETLANCQALKNLRFGNNQLTALPENLSNCQALTWLSCEQNLLTSLPSKLIAKLGENWARETLKLQQHSLTNAPAIDPGQALQIPNTLTPAHQAIKRGKHHISAREKRQLDESAILPPGAKRKRTRG
jgi:hypothetical protein